MSKRFDVIVIGVGSMGAGACYQLARRGARVLGLEQFAIPHSMGAHHGGSRMFRLAYYEHTDYVPLLKRASELWDELEAVSGYELFYNTGGIYISGPGSVLIDGAVRASQHHDLQYELLDADQLAARYPQFQLPADYQAFYEPTAGVLIPERVMCAHVGQALRHGAELRGHEPVLDWSEDDSGVTVRTERDTYRADQVVFTSGAWTGRLVKDLGIELTVTRQTLAWFWPRKTASFELGVFPVWYIETDRGYGHYGFPLLPDNPGLKAALHQPSTPTDPDSVVRELQPGDEQQIRPVLSRHIPDADGPLLALRVCLYTISPDAHFIIDRHPSYQRVSLACGFSGHGFKFSSVVGEVLADLTTVGNTEHLIEFLGLQRFA